MKKYIFRANEAYLFASFERSFVSALLGPRRVGKTTLVDYYKKLHPEKKWVSLNMDSLSQRNRVAREELRLMIEQEALQKIGGEKKLWVFIDEAQKCPELFDQVKLIYDEYKGQDAVKFILTGSAHLNLHQLTAESLAGRVELLHLREFTLRELAYLIHPNLILPRDSIYDLLFSTCDFKKLQELSDHERPFEQIFKKTLDTYLLWGGLPETFEQENGEDTEKLRLKYLGDYLQTYLEKDIRAIDTISDLQLFENLMKISAELTGSLRDDKKITEALGCSRNTLQKYRGYFAATLQYFEVFPYIGSSLKRLVKSPKGYVTNNGLISYLTGLHNLDLLKTTGFIGHRLENWFLNELQTWLDTAAFHTQISFWRTTSQAKVDFVVTCGDQIVPFEITYSSKGDTKKVSNLRHFMRDETKCHVGVLVYLGPLVFDAEKRILHLPAWML